MDLIREIETGASEGNGKIYGFYLKICVYVAEMGGRGSQTIKFC